MAKEIKPFNKGQEVAMKFLTFMDSIDQVVFSDKDREYRQDRLDAISLLGKQLGQAAMEAKAFTSEDLKDAAKYFNPATSKEDRSKLGEQMNERLRGLLFPASRDNKGSLLMRQNAGEFKKK